MHIRKQYGCFLLALCLMALPGRCCNAAAESAGICFDDGSGAEISAIPSSGIVRVRCREEAEGRIILASYRKGDLVKLRSAEAADGVSLEELADDSVVMAYLWDDYRGQLPLSRAAQLGSTDASVDRIVLDGKPLEGFAPEIHNYQATLPASYSGTPEIRAVTRDAGAKYTVTQAPQADGSITAAVAVTSQDGKQTQTYEIMLSYEPAAITDAVIKYNGGLATLGTEALLPPVFHRQPAANPPATPAEQQEYLIGNLQSFTRQYLDRNFYYLDIPPALQGAQVLQSYYGYRTASDFSDDTDPEAMRFTINKSATVYISLEHEPSWIAEMGFTPVSGQRLTAIRANDMGATWESYRICALYQKHIDVPLGETKTVSLGGAGYNRAPALVFVAWDAEGQVQP